MWKNLVPGERARNYLALQQPAKKGDPHTAKHLTGWKHGPKTSFIGGKVAHFQRAGHWSVSHPSSYLTRRRSKTVKHQQSITWLGTETKLVFLFHLRLYSRAFEGQKKEEKLCDSSDVWLGCGRMKKKCVERESNPHRLDGNQSFYR